MFKKILASIVSFLVILGFFSSPAYAALTGAIFTTDSTCTGVNLNIYGLKDDVYIDGGPAHPGAAGLPDGSYWVQVTEPGGTVLGKSSETVVTVSGGEFVDCYQLSAIVKTASSSFSSFGYDDTSNPGGEYKVWVSKDSTFPNDESKTDNFKVKEGPTPPPTAELNVLKFYDANANGLDDDNQLITGWKVRIHNSIDWIRYTPASMILDPDDYNVTEFAPLETNWIPTTLNPVDITLGSGEEGTVDFGNVCVGAGGGKTLGFWSNKNGQATMNDGGTSAPELALLSVLNLRNANGTAFDPATYPSFRTWLLGANATNMAYMLSAQLAAMRLNDEAGFVSESSLVYAPNLLSFSPLPFGLNPLGFISIGHLMRAANIELGAHGLSLSGSPDRAYQEALKNALDKANNNLTFVQSTPCAFSFAE